MKRCMLAVALALSSCHYSELAAGQLELINRQRSLPHALASEHAPARRRLLARAPDILHFARTVVQLEPGKSYRGYFATGRRGVTYVLSAAEQTALEPYTWWFPVTGEVPYKSFFDETRARDEQAELQAAGYDTWLGYSTAYSTLGFFSDPITDTMLERGLIGLVDVLIHELAHARFYVPGQTDFNEQLASFVGQRGALQYFRSRSDGDPVVMAAVRDHFERKARLEQLMERIHDELQALYASGRRRAHILARREIIFRAAEQQLAALYPEAEPEALRVNNARVLQFARYAGSTEYLSRLWRQARGNWVDFWRRVEAYAERELSSHNFINNPG